MKTEKELISEIRSYLYELEIEAYGNRRHGNKELPPSLHNFHRTFKYLYEAVYELAAIEGQEYIPQGHLYMIYDAEREIDEALNYLKAKKKDNINLIDVLSDYLLKIQGNLNCIIEKTKDATFQKNSNPSES